MYFVYQNFRYLSETLGNKQMTDYAESQPARGKSWPAGYLQA